MLVYAKASFKKKRKKAKNPIAKRINMAAVSKVAVNKLPSYDYSFRRPMAQKVVPSHHTTNYVPEKLSVMNPMSLAKESEETREAIIAKSKRIAIAYSKGAYQYVTDDTDAKTIGRKNPV